MIIPEKKYKIEDFQNVLRDCPLSRPALWFKAFRNLHPDKSETELLTRLVDYANREKLPFAFRPYRALYYIFREWILCEWELCKKGITTDDELIEWDKFLMHQFRDIVIKRDNSQCQLCGKSLTFKTAKVHHILTRYKGENQINGPSLLLNLITLCRNCHNNRIHKKRKFN